MRRFRCLKPHRQSELGSQFSWLTAVQENGELPHGLKMLSLSVFDHWLSDQEADALIPASSPDEQAHRDSLFATFYSLILAETEVLSFVWRGTKKDRPRFRSFTSAAAARHYLRHDGSGVELASHIRLVLPHLSTVYYQGWDSTGHVYFTQLPQGEIISRWAEQAGLNVLS